VRGEDVSAQLLGRGEGEGVERDGRLMQQRLPTYSTVQCLDCGEKLRLIFLFFIDESKRLVVVGTVIAAREKGDRELQVWKWYSHDSIRNGPELFFPPKSGRQAAKRCQCKRKRHGGGFAPNWPLEIGLLALDRRRRIPHIKCPSDTCHRKTHHA
jgi:hypothetical protein